MPGALDPNGVYQYAESDAASPVSDLLNLGMESVSDQLVADRLRLTALETATADTGWLTLTLPAGTTTPGGSGGADLTPKIRRVGKVVYVRGRCTSTSGDITTLATGFKPGTDRRMVVTTGGSGTTAGVVTYTSSTGKLGTAAAATVNLDGLSWLADA